ncbi:glycoprotein-N-acetylgalactosamine 3-beta-galactosyltransferase 1-A-like [Neocloeon triangulifer]|uniref:glycoprotein-N-acetylgalactosamine 3-beta-galactosyltransferase 1-A-like n=1 Tax=Neocloeon triangulifer TaxID=2078957 RepID=UPI00286F13E6|nr:glycoprotein-N-acetylgalactosamine 3-beta-galactosyltransferase 1-A-like [Neocloeon triangulifer]
MIFCKRDHTRTRRNVAEDDSRCQFFIFFATGLACGFAYSMYFYKIYLRDDGSKNETAMAGSLPMLVHETMDLNISIIDQLFMDSRAQQSKIIYEQVRVLCWVCTSSKSHTKSAHVKATWGRRCNKVIFISEAEDEFLPTVKVDAPPGREGLWAKTVEAFNHIYENYSREYDWFLKADDDSYVIVDNLRKFLLPYNTNEPEYFGFNYKTIAPKGYMSGGAGYVLSREALRRLVKIAFVGDPKQCPTIAGQGAEDADLGRCLHYAGVYPGDSRDSKGHYRFYPFNVEWYTNPAIEYTDWWFPHFIKWPQKEREDCCSKYPISFHYMPPDTFYLMENLVYQVNPFPITDMELAESPPKKKKTTKTTETTSTTRRLTTGLVAANIKESNVTASLFTSGATKSPNTSTPFVNNSKPVNTTVSPETLKSTNRTTRKIINDVTQKLTSIKFSSLFTPTTKILTHDQITKSSTRLSTKNLMTVTLSPSKIAPKEQIKKISKIAVPTEKSIKAKFSKIPPKELVTELKNPLVPKEKSIPTKSSQSKIAPDEQITEMSETIVPTETSVGVKFNENKIPRKEKVSEVNKPDVRIEKVISAELIPTKTPPEKQITAFKKPVVPIENSYPTELSRSKISPDEFSDAVTKKIKRHAESKNFKIKE